MYSYKSSNIMRYERETRGRKKDVDTLTLNNMQLNIRQERW